MDLKGFIRLLPIEERVSISKDGTIAWKNPSVHSAEQNDDNILTKKQMLKGSSYTLHIRYNGGSHLQEVQLYEQYQLL
jgi:hypothetical protein